LWPELRPERREVRLEPLPGDAGSAEPWRGALEALQQESSLWKKRVDLTVVLSNRFVRYALLPAQADGATPEEELALARFQFAKIHGERAKGWEVRVSEGLACAIDAALLEGLRKAIPPRVRLSSVQPYLMAAYNRARGRVPREGAWLFLAERDWGCLARLAPQGWGAVLNGRETDCEQLIERERSRASGEALPALVLKVAA
jgi:hypothetical protein